MKNVLKYGIFLFLIPVICVGGFFLFNNKQSLWISLCVAVLACIPFFLKFEKSNSNDVYKLVIVAVMTAISVAGRFIFAPLPGFKPVTAMVVITALYFGSEAGFLTGALTALISNFYFGQGPWTPFQMFSWGIIGFVAGLLSKYLRKHIVWLIIFGVVSGLVYSILMDVLSVLWMYDSLSFSSYIVAFLASLEFTVIYATSNAIFIGLIIKPFDKIFNRLKSKYGIGYNKKSAS